MAIAECVKMGEKLREARKKVGLTQEQVADQLKISRQKWLNIEKGEVAIDSLLLRNAARVLGHSMEYFIEDEYEDVEIVFAFRATELSPDDRNIPLWGRRVLTNLRNLQEICEEIDMRGR